MKTSPSLLTNQGNGEMAGLFLFLTCGGLCVWRLPLKSRQGPVLLVVVPL